MSCLLNVSSRRKCSHAVSSIDIHKCPRLSTSVTLVEWSSERLLPLKETLKVAVETSQIFLIFTLTKICFTDHCIGIKRRRSAVVNMASKVTIKTTFEQVNSIEPFYTGGEITANASGTFAASTIDDEDCLIVDLNTATPVCRIDGDGETVTNLALTPDADFVIISSRSLWMRIFQLEHLDGKVTAQLLKSLKPHATPVVSSAIDRTGSILATGGADGLVKVWDIRAGYCSHTFHCHGGVVTCVNLFNTKQAVANDKSKLKQSRKSMTNGTTSAETLFMASSGEEGRIKIHNLTSREQVASLESHVSVVRSLRFSEENNILLSAARDRTVVLWDASTWKAIRIVTTSEELETAGFLPSASHFYTGGELGQIRVWTIKGKEVQTMASRGLETDAISSIFHIPSKYALLAVRGDQTLNVFSYQSMDQRIANGENALEQQQTFSGNLDEVIDMACVGHNLLAIADNTENVKIMSTANNDRSFGANVGQLEGHTDVVLCVDVDPSGHWLATGSKDNTARIWLQDGETQKFRCFAILAGHTASVGAASLATSSSKGQLPAYLITGSEDKTIKKWSLAKLSTSPSEEPHAVAKAQFTRVAHEKDINVVAISSVTSIFASASQDRTIKIWSVEDGSTAAVLTGHKRGVWSVQFSPPGTPALNMGEAGSSDNRGLLISGSGDNTIKVWSLNTYSCLVTLEGHQNSVLKVLWLPHSPQHQDASDGSRKPSDKPMIASASSDTLIKVWSPYASADGDHLLATIDGHTDRVWSLATPPRFSSNLEHQQPQTENGRFSLISGAADAKIAFWTDTTATTASESTKLMTERVEQDQMLQNYIQAKNYKEVIILALTLNHPGRLLRVFEDVVNLPVTEKESGSYMGLNAVDDVLGELNQVQIYKLLERIRDWNTNARTATVAQKVLHCLLRQYPQDLWTDLAKDREILKLARSTSKGKGSVGGNAVKDLFRALEVYTDRHYKKMEELSDETYLLEYTLREMDEVTGVPMTNGGHEDVIMT